MSLSLSWTYQGDKVSLLVKFELKIIILFKYYVNMENCESFRGFDYIYIYIYIDEEQLFISKRVVIAIPQQVY